MPTRLQVDRDEIPGHGDSIEPDATDAGDVGVDSRVVMTKETDLRAEPGQQDI